MSEYKNYLICFMCGNYIDSVIYIDKTMKGAIKHIVEDFKGSIKVLSVSVLESDIKEEDFKKS